MSTTPIAAINVPTIGWFISMESFAVATGPSNRVERALDVGGIALALIMMLGITRLVPRANLLKPNDPEVCETQPRGQIDTSIQNRWSRAGGDDSLVSSDGLFDWRQGDF